ncbi:hypothetical protein Q3G72_022838 [Acer saccharum]|nr:hypothetical protein Q3G72_022838 [Acer saccharum]
MRMKRVCRINGKSISWKHSKCLLGSSIIVFHICFHLSFSVRTRSILQTHEVDPPQKEKWQTKKRIKLRRRGKPQTRGTHPRHLNVKLDKAKIKEAFLIERLELYEAPKL